MIEIRILESMIDGGSSSVDSECPLEGDVIELFDLCEYSVNLPQEAKNRYREKLSIVGCDCPYTIDGQYWLDGLDMCKVMPDVTNLDLVNYLVCTKSPYTHENLKAYKGLESYKRFIDGGIGSAAAIKLSNGNAVMKALVL